MKKSKISHFLEKVTKIKFYIEKYPGKQWFSSWKIGGITFNLSVTVPKHSSSRLRLSLTSLPVQVTSEGSPFSAANRSTLLSVLRAVQLSVLSAAGMDTRANTLSVDSQKHHSWNTSLHSNGTPTEQRCRCGLLAVSSLDSSTQWTIVDGCESGPPVHQWSPSSLEACPQLLNQSDVVLDAISVKRNAFRLAIDTASTLASVGATLLPSGSWCIVENEWPSTLPASVWTSCFVWPLMQCL